MRRYSVASCQLGPAFPAALQDSRLVRYRAKEVENRQSFPARQTRIRELEQSRAQKDGSSTSVALRGRDRGMRRGHERDVKQLLLAEVRLNGHVVDVRADLEVVRRQGHVPRVVRVEHDVPAEVHELDEVLLPRVRPAVRAHCGHDSVLERDRPDGRIEARGEVHVELTPVLREVKRSPAAGNLREIGGVGVCEACCFKRAAGVEETTAVGVQFEVLLLVETDAEETGATVLGLAVSVEVSIWMSKCERGGHFLTHR